MNSILEDLHTKRCQQRRISFLNKLDFFSFFFFFKYTCAYTCECMCFPERGIKPIYKQRKQTIAALKKKNIEIHKIRLVVLTACHTRRPKKKKKKSSCAAGPKMGDTLLKCKMTTLRAELVLF